MPTTRLLSHVRARLSSLNLTMGILLGLVGILLSAEAPGQTQASLKLAPEEPAHSMLVLDYSNSMWGQIGGVANSGDFFLWHRQPLRNEFCDSLRLAQRGQYLPEQPRYFTGPRAPRSAGDAAG